MRYLDQTDKNEEILDETAAKEIEQQLVELGSRIDDLTQTVNINKDEFTDYKNEPTIKKEVAEIDTIHAKEIDATNFGADKITAVETNSQNINAVNIKTNTLQSDKTLTKQLVVEETLASPEITALDAQFTNTVSESVTTRTLKATNAEIGNIAIDNATIAQFDIENATIHNLLTAEQINATQAEIDAIMADEVTAKFVESEAAKLYEVQARNVFYDGSLDELDPWYVHLEPADLPSETDYRIYEVPYFDTGDYCLSLRDPNTDICWWSIIVRNNHNNLTVSYSRRNKDLAGQPLTNPTLSELVVFDYFGQAPKLYIKTYVGGNLYWHNHSLRPELQVKVWNEYPIKTDAKGALVHPCIHDGETWYTKHVTIIRDSALGAASLFLIPKKWEDAERGETEYNTKVDIFWNYYLPDQSLNKNDSVEFRELKLTNLTGKWLYHNNQTINGLDPDTVNNGRLDPHEQLIETAELTKWDGKTGNVVNHPNNFAGLIYDNLAYRLNNGAYELIDRNTYDTTAWANKIDATNKLAIKRKNDLAILASNDAIEDEYEDDEANIWQRFTYVFPQIQTGIDPDGNPTFATIEYIERTVGAIAPKILRKRLSSTVDTDAYILYIADFKETFSYGEIITDKHTFDTYHNQITHVGDVIEGRWNAGDIHVTKKNTPAESDEPDYDGNLEVDGTTLLHDNVNVIDANGNRVNEVNINAENTTINYGALNLIGHQDPHVKDYHTFILDDVKIGNENDDHDLRIHGRLIPDRIQFGENDGDSLRVREDPADNQLYIKSETNSVTVDGVLIAEDKLITTEEIAKWDGRTDQANEYPISHLHAGTITHGDHIVENDLTVNHNLTVVNHSETKSLYVETKAEVQGDLIVGNDALIDKNLTVRGDLFVDGTLTVNDEETINTSGNYVTLRHNNGTPLGIDEKSGIVIHNYVANKDAAISVDNEGTFRISNNVAKDVTDYNNITAYAGKYYDGLTTTETAVNNGAFVNTDGDTLSNTVVLNDKYYHFDNTNWYELILDNDKLTLGDVVEDAGIIAGLDALDKKPITYYRAFSILTIDDNVNQPILTRAEENDIWDKAPLIWDATDKTARPATIDAPDKKRRTLLTNFDPLTNELYYEWKKSGGNGAVLQLTMAEYEQRVLITDMDDEQYIPNNALIVITDAEEETIEGKDIP